MGAPRSCLRARCVTSSPKTLLVNVQGRLQPLPPHPLCVFGHCTRCGPTTTPSTSEVYDCASLWRPHSVRFPRKTTTLPAHPLPFKLKILDAAAIGQFHVLHCEKYICSRFTGDHHTRSKRVDLRRQISGG